MHEFTSKLPLIEPQEFSSEDFIGNTTKGCILSGVYNNILREIEGIIQQYSTSFKNLTVVLTGGNSLFLAKNIKSPIFVSPNFLLEGLNAILEYNKKYEL